MYNYKTMITENWHVTSICKSPNYVTFSNNGENVRYEKPEVVRKTFWNRMLENAI